MTIRVVSGTFGSDFPVYVGRLRTWNLNGLPENVPMAADPAIFFREVAANGTVRRADVNADEAGNYHVLARVTEDGAIMARGTVAVLDIASTNETDDTNIIHTYEDGDHLVSMGLVLDNLPPGAYVKLSIFVSGVTFTDGTINKIFTAADMDANGFAWVYFNYPVGVTTSVCHRLYVYDANHNLIGTR